VSETLARRKPHHENPALGKIGVSRPVLCNSKIVLFSIDLDTKLGFVTVEVHRDRPKRILAPEMEASFVRTQLLPQTPL
jgi:hypothetical protein